MESPFRSLAGPLARAMRPWLGLALVCGGFSLDRKFRAVFWPSFADGHLQWSFLPQLLQQASTNIIVAVGMTFVILTGGIDLSVGSVLALCGVTLGMTVHTGPPAFLCYIMAVPAAVIFALVTRRLTANRPMPFLTGGIGGLAVGFLIVRSTAGGIQLEGAILAALAVGCGCGMLNGLVVTLGRVPPFVVTLGMLTAARGLTVFATRGNSISGLPPRFAVLGKQEPLLIITLVTVLFASFVLRKTRMGRYFFAIGGNEEASRLTGVDVTTFKTLAYTIAGALAALAGIVLTAKFMSADTGAGSGAELNAIAAVVIGGTRLSGGQGSIIGSLVGALTIAVLNAGLVIVDAPDTLQGVVIGAVIVVTVMIDQFRKPAAASQ